MCVTCTYVCEYVLYVAGDHGERSQEGVRSPHNWSYRVYEPAYE